MGYVGHQSLYFEKTWVGPVAYSFTQEAALVTEEVTIAIPIVMLGGTKGITKAITYTVSFATEDLEAFGRTKDMKGDTYQFKADELTDTLYVRGLRVPAMADTSIHAHMVLMAPAPYDADLDGAKTIGFFKRLDMVIEDVYRKPDSWDDLQPYLGEFSSKKMRVICREFIDHSYTGMEIELFLSDIKLAGKQQGFGELLRNYLNAQREAGTPVLERDGTAMEAGPLMY